MVKQHKIILFKTSVGRLELKVIKRVIDKSQIDFDPKVKKSNTNLSNYFNKF